MDRCCRCDGPADRVWTYNHAPVWRNLATALLGVTSRHVRQLPHEAAEPYALGAFAAWFPASILLLVWRAKRHPERRRPT